MTNLKNEDNENPSDQESLESVKASSETDNNNVPYADQIEKYGGGHITSRHGRIHWWLGVVYLVLFVWSVYYGFTYWGGLGPGLDY